MAHAHTRNDQGKRHGLVEHLRAVAALAALTMVNTTVGSNRATGGSGG